MKTFLLITSWVLGFAAVAFLLAFESVSESRTMVSSLNIMLNQPKNQLFLTKEDVRELLDKQDDSLLMRSVNAINTAVLEESLENHPFIADAEVFSTLDGLLSVQVEQKLATARVITTSKHYYLDAEGHRFPLTKTYSAAVPVFTGMQDSTSIANAYQLLNTINSTAYFEGWLAEIHTKQNRTLELVPVRGNHRVLFGTVADAEQKLQKLEAFYKTVVTEQNLADWKTLNVAYNKLLVSTKH